MTTRYRVPISHELLGQRPWRAVEGFRLISIDGPWLAHPGVSICTVEDDGAPPELEDAFVEPVFRYQADDTVQVIARTRLNDNGVPVDGVTGMGGD